MSDLRPMSERLVAYIRAAYPCLALETHEETRALGDLVAAAKAAKKGLATWSVTEGLRVVSPSPGEVPSTEDLQAALATRLDDTVLVFRDAQLWPFSSSESGRPDVALERALRDLVMWAPGAGSCVVLLGVRSPMPRTVERSITVLEYALPGDSELRKVADDISASAGGAEVTAEVLRALAGLSTGEAENALALAVIETGRLDPAVVYREKIAAVRRSGLLEIIDPDPRGLDSVGGLDVLKAWVLKRRGAFTVEARARGIDPRGMVLVGVPGAGKSQAAKSVGVALGVPTVKLDMGALYNSLIGESEKRTREALDLAAAIAPAVLWLDEIDKGLSSSVGSSGGGGDSGVSARVIGTVLQWLEKPRERAVFVVATANNVKSLPPELLRKGRWDELFAVDLPTAEERAAIFDIHLRKRGVGDPECGPAEVDPALVAATDGFVGAEIEAVVKDALMVAFDAGREVTADDLLASARGMVPLSRTAAEQVESIRAWARGRARFASSSKGSAAAAVGQTVVRKLA